MFASWWFRRMNRHGEAPRAGRARGGRRSALRPRLEALENRLAPATFTVNTTDDTPDAHPGDGTAHDASGHVSLRSAVTEADTLGGANTIVVPAGTYRLTRASTLGDLSITDGLTLSGAGASAVTVDALGLSRVFEV